jgi:hypothetical protein
MEPSLNVPQRDPALTAILKHHGAMNEAIREEESLNSLTRQIEAIDHGTDDTMTAETWPDMANEAYVGLPGEFVKAVAPYSEADPVGILLHALVGGGCLIGTGPHVLVEHTPHYARLNVILVGQTSFGRKGTAWSIPRFLFSSVEAEWSKRRVKSGLSSGEGMIYHVRDAEGNDPGEPDKRLLIIESEFASALTAMERQGNTLSPKIRDAWDHGTLSPMTKRDRLTATGAHICIVGHITPEELRRSLSVTERASGFANRFLFALVKLSRYIPSGKGVPPSVLDPYITRFARTIRCAQTLQELARDTEAETLWAKVYPQLVQEPPGLTGAMLGRGAAQVLRLSFIYALLDEAESQRKDPAIRVPHVLAALAVWEYCRASVIHIFGDAVGDPVADRLLRVIKQGPQTDTNLYEVLGKRDGGRKDVALDLLLRLNRVHKVKVPTAGRPVGEWHHGVHACCVLCVKRV